MRINKPESWKDNSDEDAFDLGENISWEDDPINPDNFVKNFTYSDDSDNIVEKYKSAKEDVDKLREKKIAELEEKIKEVKSLRDDVSGLISKIENNIL